MIQHTFLLNLLPRPSTTNVNLLSNKVCVQRTVRSHNNYLIGFFQAYDRNRLDLPKPQLEQAFFRVWYECRPQRLQIMCDLPLLLLPIEYVPFILCRRRDQNNVVATQENGAELSLNRAIFHFFSVIENNVNVNVKCVQQANILLAALCFNHNLLLARFIQRVKRSALAFKCSCFVHHHSYTPKIG